MSECFIEGPAGAAVSCGSCDWTGTTEQTEMIRDIQERLYAGHEVPAGQCPHCGALCHLIRPDLRAALRLALAALNKARRFKVGDSDSYEIAAKIEEALRATEPV